MPDVVIDIWVVLGAAVASYVIGVLWYSLLFAKPWRKLVGVGEGTMQGQGMAMGKAMGGNFVATFITAYVLAHFAAYAGAATVHDGFQLGFWVWLGFVATVGLNSVFFTRKPWKLFLIDMGFQLVSLMVMGAILATHVY